MHLDAELNDIKTKSLKKIIGLNKGSNRVQFIFGSSRICLENVLDCCEIVEVDKVFGDISDILNSPVIDIKISRTENYLTILDPEDDEEEFLGPTIEYRYYTIVTEEGQLSFRFRASYKCGSFTMDANLHYNAR